MGCWTRHYRFLLMRWGIIFVFLFPLAVGRDLDLDLASINNWGDYVVGDVVNGVGAGHTEKGWLWIHEKYRRRWPDSISTAYMNRTHSEHQYITLCDIVRERGIAHEELLPPPHEVVVHLRLGDIVNHPDQVGHSGFFKGEFGAVTTVKELWEHGDGEAGWRHYIKGRPYYERAIGNLPRYVRNVTIVGYAHHASDAVQAEDQASRGNGTKPQRSEEYRDLVVEFFESKGFRVTRRWEHLPDDDFVYMSHAPYFIEGGGGYSRLVAQCVKRLGGKASRVLDPGVAAVVWVAIYTKMRHHASIVTAWVIVLGVGCFGCRWGRLFVAKAERVTRVL